MLHFVYKSKAFGRIALGACLCALFYPAVPIRADVNLLANGSFERRSSSPIPIRWSNAFTSGSPSVGFGIATKSGENVLRILDSSNTQPAGVLSDAIPVTPGDSCTASAKVMRTDAQLNAAIFSIHYYDAGGIELGIFSNSASGVANVWNEVSVVASAPPQAATARVLCASTAASTGTIYFDGVAFRVNAPVPTNLLTKYVAPVSLGSANGSSPAHAAKFNLSTFWNAVKSDLLTRPVKIVFLEGEYVIDASTNRLLLTSIGNLTNRLTLEGERPWGTVFTRTDAASSGTIDGGAFTMVQLQRATNVVLCHLHWENDTTQTGKQSTYSLVINSAATGAQTRDIAVEGCTFVGLSWNIYGALGIHHQQTHHVQVLYCEFITGGFNSLFHMIYNAYGPGDLRFENNYFQDCSGTYLRLRAGCYNTLVRSNDFISTAASYNHPFVQLATFNNVMPGDETWGHNHTFTHNKFTYMASGSNVAMHLYHSGFDPYRAPGLLWDYLLTSAEAGVLTSGTVAEKKVLIGQNFGLHFGTGFIVSNNMHEGFHAYTLKLESRSNYTFTDTNGVTHVCPNYGGNGAYNISDLIAPPAAPTRFVFQQTGNSLTLSWPVSHQGWLVQSNAAGLKDSPRWVDISGSYGTTNLTLPIGAASNVFFRLRAP